MRRFAERLRDFYFAPGEAFTLGVVRCIVCSWILFVYYIYRGHHASFYADVAEEFWMPIHAFRWLPIPRLPASALGLLDAVWFIALVSTAAGLATRFSSVVAMICGFYLISLPQNFGKTDTSDGPVLFMLLIIAASRCGDAFSLDAVLRRYRKRPARERGAGPAYGWPIKAGQIVFVLVFGAAGISKLRNAGFGWASADNMANLLTMPHYFGLPATEVGLRIAEWPTVCVLMGVATLFCEVGSPLVLSNRKLRVVIVTMLFLMLVGFRICLGMWPLYLFGLFAFWVPWHRFRRGR